MHSFHHSLIRVRLDLLIHSFVQVSILPLHHLLHGLRSEAQCLLVRLQPILMLPLELLQLLLLLLRMPLLRPLLLLIQERFTPHLLFRFDHQAPASVLPAPLLQCGTDTTFLTQWQMLLLQ